jgi:hypothetical protein
MIPRGEEMQSSIRFFLHRERGALNRSQGYKKIAIKIYPNWIYFRFDSYSSFLRQAKGGSKTMSKYRMGLFY